MSTTDLSHGMRWSGLETQQMKNAKCSLLFSEQAEYTPFITDLVSKNPGTVNGYSRGIPEFPSWGIIQIYVKQFGAPTTVTIAGRCTLKQHDVNAFRHIMQRKATSVAIWPDSRAFHTCPFCNKFQVPGKDYWLLVHPLSQLHGVEPGHVVASTTILNFRVVCRLACISCLVTALCKVTMLSAQKSSPGFSNVIMTTPVLDLLEFNPGFPIYQRNGFTAISSGKVGPWTLFNGLWIDTGLMRALEEQNAKYSPENKMKFEMGKCVRRPNPKGTCLMCWKEGSQKVCSRCEWAVYCSAECQKKDWRRHKIAECGNDATSAKN